MSFLARGLSNIIGIVVPIIATFKILKKPTNKRLIEALHYWTIYGSFLIIDWFLTTFLITCFIPFYDFFVLIFTLFMALPHIGFASVLYKKFLAPFLRKYERRIDRFSSQIVEKIWEKIPGVAATVPAVLASMMSAINEDPVPMAHLEIEEMDSFQADGSIQHLVMAARLNRSFEIQSEDDDEVIFEQFPVAADREIKQEIPDEEELDEVPQMPVRRVGMRTRRQTRASSLI